MERRRSGCGKFELFGGFYAGVQILLKFRTLHRYKYSHRWNGKTLIKMRFGRPQITSFSSWPICKSIACDASQWGNDFEFLLAHCHRQISPVTLFSITHTPDIEPFNPVKLPPLCATFSSDYVSPYVKNWYRFHRWKCVYWLIFALPDFRVVGFVVPLQGEIKEDQC